MNKIVGREKLNKCSVLVGLCFRGEVLDRPLSWDVWLIRLNGQ